MLFLITVIFRLVLRLLSFEVKFMRFDRHFDEEEDFDEDDDDWDDDDIDDDDSDW